jgi:prephenate dehydratase
MTSHLKKIAFQGMAGAFSDLACRTVYPGLETLPCASFEDAFKSVQDGEADLAMIPVDNSIAGRVADVHISCLTAICLLSVSIFSRLNMLCLR